MTCSLLWPVDQLWWSQRTETTLWTVPASPPQIHPSISQTRTNKLSDSRSPCLTSLLLGLRWDWCWPAGGPGTGQEKDVSQRRRFRGKRGKMGRRAVREKEGEKALEGEGERGGREKEREGLLILKLL